MSSGNVSRQIAEQSVAGEVYEPIDRVLCAILGSARPVRDTETLRPDESQGRVLAADVLAGANLPGFDNAAVDGYGIGPSATVTGAHHLVVSGRICAGDPPGPALGVGEAVRLLTGAAIPPGVAAVIAEERCRLDGGLVSFSWRSGAGQNIRRAGEDVAQGEVLVDAGSVLGARHLAILAASGRRSISVRRRVRAGVLSCGNELVEAGSTLSPGRIYDTNRPMLAGLLRQPSAEVADFGICGDDPASLASAFSSAAETRDLLVASGGVFGSDRDCVGAAIIAAGGSVRRFQVAMKPGKCLLLGQLGGMTILALPGNPVAALVALLLFGRPLLATLAGQAVGVGRAEGYAATAASPFPHAIGRTEFALCRATGRTADGRVLLDRREGASAHLRPLILADGFAEIPTAAGDIAAGSPLRFHPFSSECGFATG